MGNIVTNTSFQTQIAMGGGGGGGKQEFTALFAQWTMKNWSEAGLLSVMGEAKQVLLGNTNFGGVAEWLGAARGSNTWVAKFMEVFAPKDEAWAASPEEFMKKATEKAANWVNNNQDAIKSQDWNNPEAMAAAEKRDATRQGGGQADGYDPRFNSFNNANASSGDGGGGGNGGGSNRAFPTIATGAAPLLEMGGMEHVPNRMLGGLSPSPSPGMGREREAGGVGV